MQCSVFFNPSAAFNFAGSECPGLVYLGPKPYLGLGHYPLPFCFVWSFIFVTELNSRIYSSIVLINTLLDEATNLTWT